MFCLAIFLPYFREPLYSETYVELALEAEHGFTPTNAFGGFRQGHWLPLARLLMHVQYQWFGLDAFGYKLVMFLFHTLISFLVIYFTKLLTDRVDIAAAAGFLFAVHFCHWEIVVHTNMLHYFVMMVFYMLTLIFFLKHLREKSGKWLAATYGTFVLCLISSQTGVSLIVVMLALDLLLIHADIRRYLNPRVFLKYLPFALLTAANLAVSYLLNSGETSPHNPFNATGVFSFSAPIGANFITYILELAVPVFGSRVPMPLRWILAGITGIITIGIILKGSRIAKFCLIWIFAGLFMFMFWIWPFPNSRYTYLSSIPFAIMVSSLILQERHGFKRHILGVPVYDVAAKLGLSSLIALNCLCYLATSRVRDFNIAGRNHIRLAASFKSVQPSLPEGTSIYICGIPPKSGRQYGSWIHEEGVRQIVRLYYQVSCNVKFVNETEMELLRQEHGQDNKPIFLRFENMAFHKL